jgi:hypothetical protein
MTYPVKITWTLSTEDSNTLSWNETCARILETFGLPGDRYTTEISADYMTFNFSAAEDAVVATLMVGNQAKE